MPVTRGATRGDRRTARLPISLDYHCAAPGLRRYVSSFYLFAADLTSFADVTRADAPQLRFILRGGGSYRIGIDSPQTSPAAALIGPTMAATRFTCAGPFRLFGIGLTPAGWAAIVGEDACDLADRVTDAESVFGALIADVLDALISAPDHQTMVSIANALVRALVARADDEVPWFCALAEGWLAGREMPRIDQLIAASGLSCRQVERLTARYFGAPPTLLARKYRTLRAAARLARDGADWRDVAADFYDQSHVIREFRRFTGMTPTALIRNPPPVTRLTFEKRRLMTDLPKLTLLT